MVVRAKERVLLMQVFEPRVALCQTHACARAVGYVWWASVAASAYVRSARAQCEPQGKGKARRVQPVGQLGEADPAGDAPREADEAARGAHRLNIPAAFDITITVIIIIITIITTIIIRGGRSSPRRSPP